MTLIFSGQAILYVCRCGERIWSSRPSIWLMAASVADLLVIGTLATRGIFMQPLPVAVVAILLALTVVFCLLLDLIQGSEYFAICRSCERTLTRENDAEDAAVPEHRGA